jgi:hypothetical protein
VTPWFPEVRFNRCLDYLVFIAELMHDLAVIIRELLKVKFNWPPAYIAESFFSVPHCPARGVAVFAALRPMIRYAVGLFPVVSHPTSNCGAATSNLVWGSGIR